MRKIWIILVSIICLGCDRGKQETIEATDNRPEVYSDILDVLVKKHFYNLYLGPDFEMIEVKYGRDRAELTMRFQSS